MSGASAQLRKILQPSRLALVGASSDPQSLSGRYLEHLTRHGYPGEIVPVNPRRDEIRGLKCAASVTAIEGHIDTAVVIVDGDKVLGVVDECVAREIPGIVVFSSGFSEAGPAGVERQRLIMQRVRSTDGRTRLIGPNSPGFVNYHAHTAVAASAYLQQAALKAGDVAVVSQSGAIGGIIASRCLDRGIGLSHLVFTGNEADVSAADCIEALAEDDNVTAIVAVVETLRDLRRFREAAEHAKRLGRTMLVLRIGVSAAGRRAAMAHTGALANDSHTVDAILNRVGAVVARDIDEMMNLLDARRVVAPGFNGRLGVLCTSGGLASMAADAVSGTDITLPKLSERAAARLGELIPDFGSTLNPTDLTGMIVQQPELAEHCLVGLDDDGFDAIVAVLTVHPGPLSVTLARHLIAGRRVTKTPLVVAWETGSISDDGIATLREAGIPTFSSLTGCLGALARLADGAATVDRDDDEVLADENQTTLPEYRVLELLEPHGLRGPESGLARTRGEAQVLADRLGYPLVAKIQSAQLPHRSRVGGVRLALDSQDAVEKAFDDLSELAARLNVELDGISLSESVEEGRDLFVGLRLTEAGWMLVLAPGGSDVENSASVRRSLLPLESDSAEAMVTTVLNQATAEERGVLGRAVDRVILAAETLPEGAMVLELNPVRVHAGRLVVLDALVELVDDDRATP
jgi:acyl-CoA synthetase (NDP forming)